ncbi:period circadian protein homolog 2 isoform X1 [Malaclemys terrapin pileata]|uniref:period circadian protein homolog 2 isoform X1 n=1 Tax=Malaclemys terrapin pileata TaxID=2991368 RepID=UPI0023A845B1|nr:period circadian protein homolog 2 isoform X1 [Malaclemys terrapin pileata]XP_053895239.1 period circadian protein homolog 2 isoform X1 [Malaclemys terrapin pileata]XP_053895240.1 period circadian protein homolog 2 isoform X1 [Malaclemys terrapin pileata]XP_053895241.1 period circadian protein homolog 2 isoform X1 [Malaclemys terrapin pileata]XP_053895242.1 period circadian protein homolog 2 isoform X1 [Malaclemys terrapin pileata]XP_053895243.1 period circadian protein homolog 2 isoform X1
MSGYSELANNHSQMIAEETDGQTKPEQHPDTLQEAIEMSSGSSGNDFRGNGMNENYSTGHDSHGNESDENGKDTAMLMESLDCHKSSNAFSLMIADSEHNPSTSGCSSEQSTKAKTQKELRKTLQELKARLPPEKRIKGKSSMLTTLKYALKSIQQVKANEDYYQLMMINESHPSGLDVSSYTVEEVENITSEYIMKNADMFAVAVSLITGKVLYVSDQAASILRCKRDYFKNAKFVEFLAPQDVSVFYSSTTPYRLPSWNICNGVESSTQDCMEEKSFFCRISAGKEHEYNFYHPFRMTPYLIKIQDTENAEDQLCCVLLAEKVHSGYEAPRIPPDKRIFTTTHTPSCLFQDIDERAVPLLGYLPQDLIGTPVLSHLHPSDRPLMLAVHKKILQYGGQPFDYSPIRFCTRNGEYITMDTSWSSFINPWSRKVSFIIGRHKVRTGPLNEDVFAAPNYTEDKILHPSIQEITEQIYRLLLQPVHNSGSSGYGSLGSNGSHEHLMSIASSSDSNGNNNEETLKDKHVTCQDAHMARNEGQHVFTDRRVKLEHKKKSFGEKTNCSSVRMEDITEKDTVAIAAHKNVLTEELAWKEQPVYSYQQISCLDSVIRYLESCSIPGTVKRKCEPSSNNAASLSSDDHKQKTADNAVKPSGEERVLLKTHIDPAVVKTSDKSNGPPVVGAHLTSLALPGKPESVVSFTSQCSYSSTIVHVGDKKPQPELEMIEDGPGGTELLDSQLLVPPSSTIHANQEKEPFKKLGLTKEILAVHTQKEEQSFLNKFKEIKRFKIFQSRCNYYLQDRPKGRHGERGARGQRNGTSGVDQSWRKSGKNRKSKPKRIKPQESSDSTTSGPNLPHQFPLQGLNSTAWSPSDTSQASHSAMSFPAVMPAYPLPVFSAAGTMLPGPEACLSGFSDLPDSGNNCPMQPSQFSAPLVTPVVALVLPNYMYPQMNNNLPQTLYNGQPNFSANPTFSSQSVFSALPPLAAPNPFPQQTFFPTQPFHYNTPAESEKAPAMELRNDPSRSSTPQSLGPQDQASPPLFQSRCSSPLQLNLLQLEETPKSAESGAAAGLHGALIEGGATDKPITDDSSRKGSSPIDSPVEAQNSDSLSMSSDLLDILLQEDTYSGTGSASSGSGVSAAAESLGSGSNSCGMSGSRTGSSETSHTSKYFGSIDSSENNHNTKKNTEMENSEHFFKYDLQDPIWLLMANTDDSVMMTYQIPSRNVEMVLKEDKQKLKQMQKFQPKFTEEQKRELIEVHPWIQKDRLPKAVANSECIYCEVNTRSHFYTPYDEEIHEMELNEMIEASEENILATLSQISEEQT